MKVYVVVDHVCEADIVHGVFSTKAKAKAFINADKKNDWLHRMEAPEVEEWTLNEGA